jgi:hypothetical protein
MKKEEDVPRMVLPTRATKTCPPCAGSSWMLDQRAAQYFQLLVGIVCILLGAFVIACVCGPSFTTRQELVSVGHHLQELNAGSDGTSALLKEFNAHLNATESTSQVILTGNVPLMIEDVASIRTLTVTLVLRAERTVSGEFLAQTKEILAYKLRMVDNILEQLQRKTPPITNQELAIYVELVYDYRSGIVSELVGVTDRILSRSFNEQNATASLLKEVTTKLSAMERLIVGLDPLFKKIHDHYFVARFSNAVRRLTDEWLGPALGHFVRDMYGYQILDSTEAVANCFSVSMAHSHSALEISVGGGDFVAVETSLDAPTWGFFLRRMVTVRGWEFIPLLMVWSFKICQLAVSSPGVLASLLVVRWQTRRMQKELSPWLFWWNAFTLPWLYLPSMIKWTCVFLVLSNLTYMLAFSFVACLVYAVLPGLMVSHLISRVAEAAVGPISTLVRPRMAWACPRLSYWKVAAVALAWAALYAYETLVGSPSRTADLPSLHRFQSVIMSQCKSLGLEVEWWAIVLFLCVVAGILHFAHLLDNLSPLFRRFTCGGLLTDTLLTSLQRLVAAYLGSSIPVFGGGVMWYAALYAGGSHDTEVFNRSMFHALCPHHPVGLMA